MWGITRGPAPLFVNIMATKKKSKAGAAPERIRRNPERTRARILDAARVEFARRGLGGARVDQITARAGSNKRMIYYYFGNKEALFLAALESAYAHIREAEQSLNLTDLDPAMGMRRLVEFTWEYYLAHPEFITLLNSENLHRARPAVRRVQGRRRSGAVVHFDRRAGLFLPVEHAYAVDHFRA